jgi:hypothetical protein
MRRSLSTPTRITFRPACRATAVLVRAALPAATHGGVTGFVERAAEPADRCGERFRPLSLLTDRAGAGGSLRAARASSGGR